MKILGSWISGASRTSLDVECRISSAWKAFHAHRDRFLNKQVDASIRIKALDILVAPVLLYGAGSWTLTKADLEKIHQAHKNMCARILSMQALDGEAWLDFLSRRSRRIKNLWRMLHIVPWDKLVLQKIHSWAGHIARYELHNPDRLLNIVCRWKDSQFISEKRALSYDGRRLYRGHRRPPWRWEQPFFTFYNSTFSGDFPTWRKLAQNERTWKASQSSWVCWRHARASNLVT